MSEGLSAEEAVREFVILYQEYQPEFAACANDGETNADALRGQLATLFAAEPDAIGRVEILPRPRQDKIAAALHQRGEITAKVTIANHKIEHVVSLTEKGSARARSAAVRRAGGARTMAVAGEVVK